MDKGMVMMTIDWLNILLLVFAGLGIVSNNFTVSIAALVLLLARLLKLDPVFPYLEKYGLTVGITILLIGVLAPLASGKVTPEMILRTFTGWKPLLAIAVGMLVTWIAGKGIPLMNQNPLVVTGILIGSILGVAFLRGVPVGPLIAAGILALTLSLIGK